MAERDPIYLATDSGGDPSALATFATGDTIPSGFMSSSLSATDITTLTGTFTELNSTSINSTSVNATSINVSSNVGLQCSSTSSIHTSASVGIDGDLMPIPAPLIWLRMEADGATHVSERDFGFDVAVIGVSSVPDYFDWDDSGSNNRLYVSADGVYKVTANCSVISDTTIEVKLNLKINSTLVHYATQMVHTLTDPHRIGLTYVGVILKNQPVQLTRTANGAAAIALKKYSTLLIERVG